MAEDTRWGRVADMTTKQKALLARANDCCGGSINWYRHPAWTEAMRAALATRRALGGKWFSLIDRMYDPRWLGAAWARLNQSRSGAARQRGAGVDGVTLEQFSQRAEEEIGRLVEELRQGSYRPKPVRRHYIPKPGSRKKRPLGLPSVRDKVVQEALRSLIEPIFESEFLDASHGFRPGRSTDTACQQLEAALQSGQVWVVDADIQGFFDNIKHEKLLDQVNRRVADGKVLGLIRAFLEAGVMEEMKVSYGTTGTPQGGVISPLLANIFLHALDERWQSAGMAWVRYADDFLLLASTREEAEAALAMTQQVLEEMGLVLSSEKTRIVHLEAGFDFLGWHYQGPQRWPRQKSVKSLRRKLRQKTRRLRPGPMPAICRELKTTLQGWFHYFRDGNSGSIFSHADSWLRRRLRSILNRRHRRGGLGSLHLNRRWTNSVFRDWGLFDLTESLRSYRQFWSMIHTLRHQPAPCSGEPCAGKPPARFGGRGG